MRTRVVNLWLLIPVAIFCSHCSPRQSDDAEGWAADDPVTPTSATSPIGVPSAGSGGGGATMPQPTTPTVPANPSDSGAQPPSSPSESPAPQPTAPMQPVEPEPGTASEGGQTGGETGSAETGESSSGSTNPSAADTTDESEATDATSDTSEPREPIGGPIEQPSDPCAPRAGYRNLFAELLSKSEAEVDAKIDAAYQQLFHGGSEETLYYETGADEAYILDVNNNDVRSEGMSYGMTIAVQLDKKEEFDRLWKWSRNRMYVSSGQLAGYFNWQMSPNGQVIGGPSAPDGEEYFVTALILAHKKWGDGTGIFDYSTEARNLLSALATKGNFNRETHLVTFGPTCCYGYTDPSYVLPAFYEMWACFEPQSQFWKNAISAARTHLQRAPHPQTGLAPYLANFDGSPYPSGGDFNTDSWRVVGNIMMDYHLYRQDDWHTDFANRFADFFASQVGKQPVPAEFTLNGNPTVSYEEPAKGLVAQNALVAFGVSPEKGRPFVEALWDSPIPTGQYRYYDGMLYMLALLHASGRFKVD